jgi:DNA-binding MarR family transcriptional regulator
MARAGKPDPARVETIDLLMGLSHVLATNVAKVAAEYGLTPAQARVVVTMEEPAPMRDLAERLACDKSNVTGLIDGLEERSLVARQPDPHDRRVKQLVLTETGRRLRSTLHLRLYTEAPALSNLTPAEEQQMLTASRLRGRKWCASIHPAERPSTSPA